MIIATWAAFLGYCAAAIWLGSRAASRHESGDAFWTAGRDLDAMSVGMSLSAGFLSVSWSCVYAVQLFYGYGLGALLLMTVPWLLALAGIHALAGRYRSLAAFSQPQMVGDRFGAPARRSIALALAFVFLVWGGAEIWVAASLLAPALAVAPALLVLLIGTVVATYSLMGGFRAVVATDRLQYVLVVAYVGAMAWLALLGLRATTTWQSAGDGVGAAWAALAALPLRGAVSGRPWTDMLAAGLVTVLITFLAYLPGWLFETDLWLRVQAARDARTARRGVAFAAVNALLFVGLAPAFIGIAALIIFPTEGGRIPVEVGAQGDAVFAALVARYAPPWLQLLASVGIVAAAMSTIDTCTNVVALSLARDLDGRHDPALATARAHQTRARARIATLVAVIGASAFALAIESLWDVFYLSSGVLTTAVAFPVAAVFMPWATAGMVTGSSIGGLVTTILAYLLEANGPLAGMEPEWLSSSGLGFVMWGLAGAVLGGLIGARWRRERRQA